jgi:hypothetical protein
MEKVAWFCVFCLNPGVGCLTSIRRHAPGSDYFRGSSLPHVSIPVEQATGIWSITSRRELLKLLTGASKTRGRRARRRLVPKNTERQRDLVVRSVHESADLAIFFPG